MKRLCPRPLSTAVIFLLIVCSACVPPLPLKTRYRTIDNGSELELNVRAIKPAVTTRDEVMKMFGNLQIKATSSEYWGRYMESSSSDPGASRAWFAKNLFVSFDPKGVVTSYVVRNDGELLQPMCHWLESEPSVRPSVPESLEHDKVMFLRPWIYHHGVLHLSPAMIQFHDLGTTTAKEAKPDDSFEAPLNQLKRFSLGGVDYVDRSPRSFTLHFTIQNPGKHDRALFLETDFDQTWVWIEFLRKAGVACSVGGDKR